MFHLITHAFFKALLFLGAGAVIHALGGEQDMRRMGGCGASCPSPPSPWWWPGWPSPASRRFAGFWSKDEILAALFARGRAWRALWAVGLLTALLTAFYMSRMIYLTFFGAPRWAEGAHPHEAPRVMTVPLAVLAVPALGAGAAQHALAPRAGADFLDPAFEGLRRWRTLPSSRPSGCWRRSRPGWPGGHPPRRRRPTCAGAGPPRKARPGTWCAAATGWTRPTPGSLAAGGGAAARFAADTVDQKGIDGLVNGVGVLVRTAGERLRPLQTGFVRQYGLGIVAGAVALLAWFLSRGGV